jgi:polar amino acid transport system substrate-binding protein
MSEKCVIGRAYRALLIAFSVVLTVVVGLTGAKAQTINQILTKGKIVIGINQDFPPFAFTNAEQKPDGLNIEVARLLAKYMGVEPEIKQVISANRVAFLVSGQVDMLVASLGVTPERAKQVMFTIPYAATATYIVAPKSKHIAQLSDLSGIRIGVGRASSNDIFLTQMAPKDAKIQRYEGEAAAAQALISGQVDALSFGNTMLPTIRKANPTLEIEPKIFLRAQMDAIAVRKDAFELKEWLNATIYYIKSNGELDAIYKKWLETPLPELAVF